MTKNLSSKYLLLIGLNADFDLTMTDKGIGMTRNQLIENLGTTAKSGTSNFVEKIKESQASN